MNPPKKWGAVMFPAAVRCPTRSCTFHLSHQLGVVHWSGERVSRNSASERRSAWIIGSMVAIDRSPRRGYSTWISVTAKLDDNRISSQSWLRSTLHAGRAAHPRGTPLADPARDPLPDLGP